MGFIDFTNGEVLTADQMDLVMRQGVMRFADATARDTALSEVLAEGMMAYLDDTDEVLKYDGTDWIDISGDITGVTAGTALTGGGTSGNVTLDVDESALTIAQSQVTDLVSDLADKQDDVITTQGDLVIGDASGDPVRLPVGSADQVLTSDGTTVSFQDAAGGGGELYAAGNHTVSKDAGFYLVESTATSTANNSKVLNNGINELPAVTSLEVPQAGDVFTTQDAGFNGTFIQTVSFGNNLFVAAGSAGKLASSQDGTNWTQRTSQFGSQSILFSLFSNGLFIIAGTDGLLSTSTDGITWTARTSTVSSFFNILSLEYGDGLYALGTNSDAYFATSTDGITWTRNSDVPINQPALAYGNNNWVIADGEGDIYSTTDPTGSNWTQRKNIGPGLNSAAFGNNVFIVVGNSGSVETSTDAITFTSRSTPTSENLLRVRFVNNKFYAVGDGGTAITSTDGITWTIKDLNFTASETVKDIAFGNNSFVATGDKLTLSADAYLLLTELPTPIQP